jgi:choline monooxygenase
MVPHSHNPDLARASTIPASWYTDPAMLVREREMIFRRTWQFACALELLALPGNFVAVDLAGVPIVVLRDRESILRAFYNVCRHRAGRVACGAGNRKSLQCAYHGWVYDLDGALRRAPEFEGVEDFRREDFGLVPVRIETWGPFAFVNLDGSAPPMSEWMGEITAEVAGLGMEKMRRVERRDYTIEANWKLYVDNYLEGYHLPIAHPGLFKELDYENYRVETFRWHSRQHAPIRPVRSEDESGRHYVSMEGDNQAHYYWLFPNFMLNIYLGMVQINVIVPLSHDRTLTIFEWYYADSAGGEAWNTLQDSISFSDEIQKEDITICEDVWRNLSSGAYERGRYSVKRENGVHHFHGLLSAALG